MDKKKLRATIAFIAVIGGVLGLFVYLSTLDRPPTMGTGPQHRFRFNTEGELVGTEAEAPPGAAIVESGFKVDRKAVEKRVNATCVQCHGAPDMDLTTHPCATGAGPCIGPHHPPKLECIKCHRVRP